MNKGLSILEKPALLNADMPPGAASAFRRYAVPRAAMIAVVLVPTMMCAGCESRWDKADRRRQASLDRGRCVVHKSLLQPRRMYAQTGKGCFFFDPVVMRAYARFPNALPLSHRLERGSRFAQGTTISFCPACEAKVAAGVPAGERPF